MDSDDSEEFDSHGESSLKLAKPYPPSSCGAKSGDRTATVWWSKSENNPKLKYPISEYIVYKYRLDGTVWNPKGIAAQVDVPLTSANIEYLTNDKTYRFSVVASCCDGKYASSHSPYSQAITPCIPLPEPWKQHIDPGTKRTYFYNPETKERSWIRPTNNIFRLSPEIKSVITEKQISKYRNQFRDFDKNGNGSIDIDELKKLLVENQLKVSKSKLKKMMRDMDINNDGTLDFNEYVTMLVNIKNGERSLWTGLMNLGEKIKVPAAITGVDGTEERHRNVIEGKKRMGDWVMKRDEKTNRDYYYNRTTKHSCWSCPEDVLWYVSDKIHSKYTEEELAQLKELFVSSDKDSSGHIDADELTDALHDMGLQVRTQKFVQCCLTRDRHRTPKL